MEKDTLKMFAKEAGADVFGVSSVERFDDLPPERHPRTIFPETRSVVVLGRRITRGTLRGVEDVSATAASDRGAIPEAFTALCVDTHPEAAAGHEVVGVPGL